MLLLFFAPYTYAFCRTKQIRKCHNMIRCLILNFEVYPSSSSPHAKMQKQKN